MSAYLINILPFLFSDYFYLVLYLNSGLIGYTNIAGLE